jgi:hypothetical protein
MSDDIPTFPGKPLGNGYNEVTAEEMKDWVVFRPEIPDPDGDTGELPHERVKKSTTFSLLDIIIFFDWASTSPVDASGCNQWAFVVDENQALYIRGKVRSVPLGDVHKLDNATVIHRIPEALGKLVAPILLKYKNNPMMFQIVINHMQCNNFVPIIFDEFFPPDVRYATNEEYEAAWQQMVASLEPRDLIFTFNRKSFVSKIIATFTHGPFSHCAVHAEDGVISEIVTSGTRMVHIDIYKGREFRVAVFRHYGKAPDAKEEMLARMRAEDGRSGYSYFGAIQAGLRAYLGNHIDAMAPNSIILSGALSFIAQA